MNLIICLHRVEEIIVRYIKTTETCYIFHKFLFVMNIPPSVMLRNCDTPKLLEALKSKRVRDIACGSSHSAAIISNGDLYTWGLGDYGRLGHGDNTTQLKPKQVRSDKCKNIIQSTQIPGIQRGKLDVFRCVMDAVFEFLRENNHVK